MKRISLFLPFCLLIFFANAQYQLVEKFESTDINSDGSMNFLKIPYSKYVFDNGLTLILSENHSNPLINVNMTYRVGSANDYGDRTGMAYLIYSMMNNGSRHLSKGQFEKTIRSYGGKIYSEITRDKTTFSTTAPNNMLETILWMESDRLAYLVDSLTEENFNKTKGRVTGFIYDSLFNKPYGLANVMVNKCLYPFTHPYSWPEFGMLEHYESYQLPDLKQFFLDWYGTNNTIITISGDLNIDNTLKTVSKYFSSLTRAPKDTRYLDDLVKRLSMANMPLPEGTRYISYQMDVKRPMLIMSVETVPKYDPAEPALNVMATILDNPNSILYDELVNKGYATYVHVEHHAYKYSGEFLIKVVASEDTSLTVVKNKLMAALNNIVKYHKLSTHMSLNLGTPLPFTGYLPIGATPPVLGKPKQVTPEILNKIEEKKDRQMNDQISNQFIFESANGLKNKSYSCLQSLYNLNIALADCELYQYKPGMIEKNILALDRANNLSNFDLFYEYIIVKPALFISIVPPKKSNLIAAPDNIKEMALQTIITHVKESDLAFRFPQVENNQTVPKINKISKFNAASYRVDKYVNGVTFISSINKENPSVVFQFRVNCEKLVKLCPDYDMPSLIAYLMMDWMNNTPLTENPLMQIKVTGTLVDIYPEKNDLVIQLQAPKEHSFLARDALLQFMHRPEIGFDMVLTQLNNVFDQQELFLGFNNHKFDNVINQLSLSQCDKLDQKDTNMARDFRRKDFNNALSSLFTLANFTFIIYGDYDPGQMNEFMMGMEHLPLAVNQIPGNDFLYKFPLLSPGDNRMDKIFILNSNDTAQPKNVSLYVNYMDQKVEVNSNFVMADFCNYLLGGAYDNFLKKALKNKQGISNLASQSNFHNGLAKYSVSATISPDIQDSAIIWITNSLKEFKNIKLSKKDIQPLKLQYLQNDLVNYETYDQKINQAIQFSNDSLGNDYLSKRSLLVNKIKPGSFKKFLNTNISEKNVLILIVGGKNEYSDMLNDASGKVNNIDKSGTVLNQ
jgi:zinc protease